MSRSTAAVAGNADSVSGTDARARLIEAASALFVRKGFSGVSIREIADGAGANSALISYYFGDKQGLFMEVFKAAAEPINAQRMVRFDRLAAAGKVTVEDLVEAWIAPMFEGIPASQEIPVAALSLSLNTEYGKLSEQMIVQMYDTMNERFLGLLEGCLPGVSRATLVWRLYFLVGAVLTASRQRAASMKSLSKGVLDGRNRKELVRQLVAFTAAGFRALEPEVSAAGRAVVPVATPRSRRGAGGIPRKHPGK
jgi:AcrR family transcriptional regulator